MQLCDFLLDSNGTEKVMEREIKADVEGLYENSISDETTGIFIFSRQFVLITSIAKYLWKTETLLPNNYLSYVSHLNLL